MSEAIIHTVDLVKTYSMGEETLNALDLVTLDILGGEFVAIMGPSGSGKSTLMNIIGCLDRPTSGEYFLGEDNVSKLNKTQLAFIRNQRIGFVFQSYNLLPRSTALENVMLPLVYSRNQNGDTSTKVQKGKALESLKVTGLEDRSNHLPAQLSGGQQQRVAIARALVNDPLIILADEPTGNLDTKSGVEIMEVLSELNQRGRTILMVTHSPETASYAHRTIHLRDGKIEKVVPNHNGEKGALK
jgi:putative ABC transport system ATP-binding protein